jgi:hypothetical protein
LTSATFWFDGARTRVQGWTDGSTWNNWGVPLFDERQLPAAIRALEEVGFHVTRRRTGRGVTLRLKHEDESHANDYPGETIEGKRYWRMEGLTWNYEPAVRGTRTSEANRGRDLLGIRIAKLILAGDVHAARREAGSRTSWTVPEARAIAAALGRAEQLYGQKIGAVGGVEPKRDGRRVAREDRRLSLPGWSVGWSDEIGAEAAVRDLKPKAGRRRILVMTQDDREPRDPGEPVDLGLYDLVEGESWELVYYASFDTPENAVRAARDDSSWA